MTEQGLLLLRMAGAVEVASKKVALAGQSNLLRLSMLNRRTFEVRKTSKELLTISTYLIKALEATTAKKEQQMLYPSSTFTVK